MNALKRVVCVLGGLVATACDSLPDFSEKPKAEAQVPLVQEITEAEYHDFIRTPGKVVAVIFHAEWCGPCRKHGPVVEKVAKSLDGKVVIGRVNVDDARDLALKLGVSGIPDTRLFRDGLMVDSMKGAIPAAQIRGHLMVQVGALQPMAEGNAVSPGTPPGGGSPVEPMSEGWLPPGIERR